MCVCVFGISCGKKAPPKHLGMQSFHCGTFHYKAIKMPPKRKVSINLSIDNNLDKLQIYPTFMKQVFPNTPSATNFGLIFNIRLE